MTDLLCNYVLSVTRPAWHNPPLLEAVAVGVCRSPAAVRFREKGTTNAWLGRCAGWHADALSTDYYEIEALR